MTNIWLEFPSEVTQGFDLSYTSASGTFGTATHKTNYVIYEFLKNAKMVYIKEDGNKLHIKCIDNVQSLYTVTLDATAKFVIRAINDFFDYIQKNETMIVHLSCFLHRTYVLKFPKNLIVLYTNVRVVGEHSFKVFFKEEKKKENKLIVFLKQIGDKLSKTIGQLDN